MAKQQPSIVIDKLGTHLLRVTNNHTGQVDLKWDWDKLLEEVRAATGGQIKGVSANPLKGSRVIVKDDLTKAAKAKKDLVKETEAKVSKSRTKAAEKPAPAKKPAAKKKAATKKSTK